MPRFFSLEFLCGAVLMCHIMMCVLYFGVTSWELVVPAAARRAGPGFEQKIQYDTTILYVRR